MKPSLLFPLAIGYTHAIHEVSATRGADALRPDSSRTLRRSGDGTHMENDAGS
jgi:hypothetical protein